MKNIFSKEFWQFWSRTAPYLALLSILFSFVWLLLNGFENTDNIDEQYCMFSNK